jgi:hypothetical protein
MTILKTQVIEMVKNIDEINAEYILNNNSFEKKLGTAERFEAEDNDKMVKFMLEEIAEYAKQYNEQYLTPANIKVGDGVTMHLYSDAHAGTVIKVTKTTVTVQRDKATLNPNFKPEFVVGGFAGHCTNQNEQTYTYEQNPNVETVVFRWSTKYGSYRNNAQGRKLMKGRHEFYDYNF